MSLYDVIDDISARRVVKTETGDNRVFGVLVGTVAKNYDKDQPGRLCVSIPVRDKDANELQWARLALNAGGKNWGIYYMPEVGDQVLLAFEGGNLEKPYVIGSVPKDGDKFLGGCVHEKNQVKRMVTRYGSTIQFDDVEDGEGKKDQILIQTAQKGHRILLNNEDGRILLSDKDGKNKIDLATTDGTLTIQASSKLTIKVGDSIKVILNGDTGAVSIESKEFTVKASGQLKLQSDSNFNASGAEMKLSAGSTFKVDSSGMVKVAGSPISMG